MTPDEAVKEWALRKLTSLGLKAVGVEQVDFGMGNHGVCSTCDWPYAGVSVYYKQKNGHKQHEVIEPEGGLIQMFAEVHQIMQA